MYGYILQKAECDLKGTLSFQFLCVELLEIILSMVKSRYCHVILIDIIFLEQVLIRIQMIRFIGFNKEKNNQ